MRKSNLKPFNLEKAKDLRDIFSAIKNKWQLDKNMHNIKQENPKLKYISLKDDFSNGLIFSYCFIKEHENPKDEKSKIYKLNINLDNKINKKPWINYSVVTGGDSPKVLHQSKKHFNDLNEAFKDLLNFIKTNGDK